MHLEKPSLARHLGDPTLKGYAVLQKIFFAPTASSQAAGGAFIERLARRSEDLDTRPDRPVAAAQMAAFREWEQSTGTRFGDLEGIRQPTLVVNGIHDEMIPVSNSYRWREPSERRASRSTRTPDTAPSSSFTSPSRGRQRHSSRPSPRPQPTESRGELGHAVRRYRGLLAGASAGLT
jgi:pimeloyl-ACP methyl ester carboxylesterase